MQRTKCVLPLAHENWDMHFANCFFGNFFISCCRLPVEFSLIDLPLKERYIWLHFLSFALNYTQLWAKITISIGYKAIGTMFVENCYWSRKGKKTVLPVRFRTLHVCMRKSVLVTSRFVHSHHFGVLLLRLKTVPSLALLVHHLTFVFNAWILSAILVFRSRFIAFLVFIFLIRFFTLLSFFQLFRRFGLTVLLVCVCVCVCFFLPLALCTQFWINKFEYLHRVFSQTFRFGNFLPFFYFPIFDNM